MLQHFLVTIRLKNHSYTPWVGDTIWGMVCWMILLQEGESTLQEFLQESESSPQAIFSSAFPSGYLPFPQMPKPKPEGNLEIKKIKKIKYISKTLFKELRKKFSFADVYSHIEKDLKSKAKHFREAVEIVEPIPHNTIDRLTGMVLEEGGLYFSEVVARRGTKLDIYFSIEEKWVDVVQKAFLTLGEYGYGKDASLGGGSFEILEKDQVKFQKVDPLFEGGFNSGVSLSPFIPSANDPTDIYYTLTTRYGKVGAGLGLDDFENGFYKTPLLLMDTGACILKPNQSYVGCLVSGIHKKEFVKQSAYSQVLGFNLEG
ncbi:MAG: hypothetical protein N3A69_00850 [Leptospiraceae bacterium]|nr:hypothetical protein [Leptospiraceae bacterium]